jgi:uncharacterized protein DUF4157
VGQSNERAQNGSLWMSSYENQASRPFGHSRCCGRRMNTRLATRRNASGLASALRPVGTGLLLSRCACGGAHPASRDCDNCREDKPDLRRRTNGNHAGGAVPSGVYEVLHSPGQPLDAATRALMEPSFGHDFARVRVHTDAKAAESARAVRAVTYTMGEDIVFSSGAYGPHSPSGRQLLAHELTHVVQQRGEENIRHGELVLGDPDDPLEAEAMVAAQHLTAFDGPRHFAVGVGSSELGNTVRRQTSTPESVDAGEPTPAGQQVASPAGTRPVARVCSRPLGAPLGIVGNHSYIHAPPDTYAVITPLCKLAPNDTPTSQISAQKWDRSPDPCEKAPKCVECVPKPGAGDVSVCLRSAFEAYPNPSLYNAPNGPNSNTFAGTLARACCANLAGNPPVYLGNMPGWDHAPSRLRLATCPEGGPEC